MKPNRDPHSAEGYTYLRRPSFLNVDPKDFARLREPLPDQLAGDIRLAFVANSNTIFGLRRDELTQHMLITGRSGTGKTSVMRVLQLELYRQGIPFFSIDITKPGTRFIKKYIPDLRILRCPGEFVFQPFIPPPGSSDENWGLVISEVTSEVFGFGTASKSAFVDVVDRLRSTHDSHNTGTYPNIFDLHKLLGTMLDERQPSVQKDSIRRIRNKTKAICIALGHQASAREGTPLEELLEQFVCIELMRLSVFEVQIWIVSMILAWIAAYRSAKSHLGKLRHVLFFDEAARLFR
jgi:hypothetical protein